jgi:stage II sporulation protein AA (anti-sigma F factor antagonist)
MADLDVKEIDGVTVAELSGELTNAGMSAVERGFVVTVSAAGKLVADLSGVTMITTPGITMLVAADKQLKRRGGKLVLCGITGNVEQVLLERCRLDVVLNVEKSQQDAIKSAKA